jgi:4-hydroxy-tetrahydrodipicolinate reductase
MIRIGISGCNGAMGRILTEIIANTENVSIALGIDRNINLYNNTYPVYENTSKIDVDCDVIIDFSNPNNLNDLLSFCKDKNVGIVIATTGLSKQQQEQIQETSKYIPVFKSSNTSIGINILIDLAKKATRALSDTFDIEIIEKHHNKKVDAPSGTAYMLANAMNEELDNSMEYNYGREGNDAKRNKKEIGIHAVRGGTIPGEHTVIFAGMDEIIEIKHTAISKKVFAEGAVKAAKYIANKEPRLYCMNDLINNN